MTVLTHRCAVRNCRCTIPRHLLLCGDHWAMVPWDKQEAVKQAWRRLKSPWHGAAGTALIEHHRAAAAAVAAATDREIQRQADRLRAGGDLFDPTGAGQAEASKTEERHGNIERGPQRPPAA